MHRIDTSTAQADKFGAGKNGFTGGNPQTGQLPTALDQDFFDALQEEISRVIEAADIALDKENYGQLSAALDALYAAKDSLDNKQDKHANLTALSGLTGVADRLPYFTAAQTMALATLTSAGRSLISQANANGMLTYLGALKITNNLSEIAAAGSAAQISALMNIGVGDSNGYVGRLINTQVITASGAVNRAPGAKKWRVMMVGGGGGGGGAAAPATGSQACAFGGGGGAFADVIIDNPPATVSATVGAAGTAGAAGANSGGVGGDTVLGSYVTCPGGISGTGGATTTATSSVTRSTATATAPTISGVSATIRQEPGQVGTPIIVLGLELTKQKAGDGGSSPLGTGGGGGNTISTAYGAGLAGSGWGAGGGGGACYQTSTARAGAAGTPGVIIIMEYA